jgi:hypothetical protein
MNCRWAEVVVVVVEEEELPQQQVVVADVSVIVVAVAVALEHFPPMQTMRTMPPVVQPLLPRGHQFFILQLS